jgi:mono/diheme cytochrome c family protein
VTVFAPAEKVSRVLLSAAPLLLALPMLAGCDQSYPADMRYPLRTDPVLEDRLTEEPKVPDRPGQLPILSIAAMREPGNPLFLAADKARDPLKVSESNKTIIERTLRLHFGTPAEPKVYGVEPPTIKTLKLERPTLAKGSALYRIHCLHCHGLPGDGRGPTAFWVNPHPRDYRQGKFKFISTNAGGQKARRADLVRVMRHGIDGTSMPAFNLLSDADLEAMASYVIHLSIRGECEYYLYRYTDLIKEGTLPDGATIPDTVQETLSVFSDAWVAAERGEFSPAPPPFAWEPSTDAEVAEVKAAVQRGQKFFNDQQNGCIKCHTDYGRTATYRYDDWGTMTRPMDLTQGTFRGGRRPIDLYWRMHFGIDPSGMASFSDAPAKTGQVQTLWDIVKFVEILPYPGMRDKYGVRID